jgi:endonuclease I
MNKRLLAFILLSSSLTAIAQPPANYYSGTAGTSCGTLKTILKNVITTGNTPKTYTDLWTQYMISDVKPREVGTGSATVIWDVYSDIPGPANDPYNFTPGTGTGGQQDQGSGGTSEGQFYNREHTVPLSWFSGNTSNSGPATDYLHILPTDKRVNGVRANWPYGNVATATFTSLNGSKLGTTVANGMTGTVFEPIDSFKGDVARAFLYFVTRYEDNMSTWASNAEAAQAFEPNTYPSVDIPFLRVMLQWNDLDPVSQKEIIRNNAAYTYQGNRNPYIDSPQYVNRVWNSGCPGMAALPVDIVSFTGRQSGDNVLLEWVVENEVNFDRFEIERSVNGSAYTKVGEVRANNSHTYNSSDNIALNKGQRLYYRLKKIDKDGKYKYSYVFSLHIPLNNSFTVYPNPASTYIQLQMSNIVNGEVNVEITDVTGKVVRKFAKQLNGSTITLSTSGISNGTYLVNLRANGEQYTRKVIVRN